MTLQVIRHMVVANLREIGSSYTSVLLVLIYLTSNSSYCLYKHNIHHAPVAVFQF